MFTLISWLGGIWLCSVLIAYVSCNLLLLFCLLRFGSYQLLALILFMIGGGGWVIFWGLCSQVAALWMLFMMVKILFCQK